MNRSPKMENSAHDQRFQQYTIYGGRDAMQNYDNRFNGNQNYSNDCNWESQNTDESQKNSTWKIFQIISAEVVGTAILIYVGCMSCSALGFGFGLLLAAQTFGHISGGYFNPAISIAALIMGEIKLKMFPVYVLSQFAGAFIGYGLHYVNYDAGVIFTVCGTEISFITEGQAVLIEILATAFLAIACCSFWDKDNPNNDGTGSIKASLLLAGLIFATSKFTGASFNTARSLPPALIFDNWDGHWVYWVGPNIGGAIGALFYRTVISNKTWNLNDS